jgi:polyhydroxyalkanoate synthase subunit PhaC
MLLWLSSRAALTSLPTGWTRWNAPGELRDEGPTALADAVARLGPESFRVALDRELGRRAGAFLAGLEAYRRHSYRRATPPVPVLWCAGSMRLLDYGRGRGGAAVLLVPSLINRYYILDLLPERSFVRRLAAAGLRPLVIDWGDPGAVECGYSLDDYLSGPLDGALTAAAAANGGRPVALLGYCMGGLLALAAALRRPADVAALALLATPWDFHSERRDQAQLLGMLADWLPLVLDDGAAVPLWIIQSVFLALDPFLAERKFVRFAAMDPAGAAARGFVALEDWVNDGVPLARRVAVECACSWYRDNAPARRRWRVGGRPVIPAELQKPTLVVLPSRDRLVPPASAAPLAAAIAGATVMRPPFGHIGMMASAAAPRAVWRPIAEWLLARLC